MKIKLVLLSVLLSVSFYGFALEAYIAEEIVQGDVPLTVKDFLISSNGIPRESATVVLSLPSVNPSLISEYKIKILLREVFSEPCLIIGKRPIFIPARISDKREEILYKTILNLLRSIYPKKDETLEARIISYIPDEVYEKGGKVSIVSEDGNSIQFKSEIPSGPFYFTVEINRESPVRCARSYIRAGEVIDNQNVIVKMMDNKRIGTKETVKELTYLPVYAVKDISSGTPIYEDNVSHNEIVKHGEVVSIILSKGGIRLELAGRTLEQSEVGKAVMVKPFRGTKILNGIIGKKGVVYVRAE